MLKVWLIMHPCRRLIMSLPVLGCAATPMLSQVLPQEQQQARQTGNAPPRRSSQQHPEVDIVSGATAGQGDNSQAQAGLMDIPQPAASSHAEPSTAQALEGADTQQGTAESGGQDDAEEDEEEFDEEEDEDEEEEEDDDLDAAAQSYEEDEEDEDLDDTVVSQQRPDSPGKQPLDAATRPSEPMTELPSNPPQAQVLRHLQPCATCRTSTHHGGAVSSHTHACMLALQPAHLPLALQAVASHDCATDGLPGGYSRRGTLPPSWTLGTL